MAQTCAGDPQASAGSLGPHTYPPYSARWAKRFGGPTDVPYSHFRQASENLHADVVAKIEVALDLPPTDPRVERPLVERLRLPSEPFFAEAESRSKVASVLRAFACWQQVGYHPELAQLAAHIMCVVGEEQAAFQALVSVYRMYQLRDYFQGPNTEEALWRDAARIWDAARLKFPDLACAFVRFNQMEQFQSTVVSLLSTLLTETYSPARQGFEHHVRLLHFLLLPAGRYYAQNPRAQLRRLVLYIMARHENAFMQCSSESQVTAMAKEIEHFVQVDDILLEMLHRMHRFQGNNGMWPSALMAGLGAFVAQDISSPLGLGAHVLGTFAGAVAGFAYGAWKSAQWTAEAAVLTRQDLDSDLD